MVRNLHRNSAIIESTEARSIVIIDRELLSSDLQAPFRVQVPPLTHNRRCKVSLEVLESRSGINTDYLAIADQKSIHYAEKRCRIDILCNNTNVVGVKCKVIE